MARGRKKNLTLEEQLQQIDSEISSKELEIKELKEKKKQVEEEIKGKQLEELYSIVRESGKSLDEIKEMLTNE